MRLVLLVIGSALVNNVFLTLMLGASTILGLSATLESAVSLGRTTILAMALSAVVAWCVQRFVLVPLNVAFLQPVVFAVALACLLQALQAVLSRVNPGAEGGRGAYWTVVTTNCAVLGVALLLASKGYNLIESVAFGLGSGLGALLALVMMAGIRTELRLADVPESLRGFSIALLVAGMLALSFRGFAGLVSL